ncbi:MAG: hypothetical protein II851_06970 [Bacteroidales bacterium]|nr:hypothetical protein [Bacteroidales bacterium]
MARKEIKLKDIFKMTRKELLQCKLHLACNNGSEEPLDVYLRDQAEWFAWNASRAGRNDFNRPLIFCLIRDYHREDVWLFAGVLRVTERLADWKETKVGYKVEMTDIGAEFAGRLMIGFHRYPGLRGRSFKLETFFKEMTVHEILDKPYEIKLIYG